MSIFVNEYKLLLHQYDRARAASAQELGLLDFAWGEL
jgi:hypothetical protein